jgi:hypothetical protein
MISKIGIHNGIFFAYLLDIVEFARGNGLATSQWTHLLKMWKSCFPNVSCFIVANSRGNLPFRSVQHMQSRTWKEDNRMKWMQRSIVALLVAGPLSLGFVGLAAAQTTVGDGLVNVAIGDIEVLNDANIGIVAEVAAEVCGVRVSNIAVLAEQVDRSGGERTVCETDQGPVIISDS